MFASRYPPTPLKHVRVLSSHGEERGLSIVPKPFAKEPPERIHHHSCVFPLPTPGKVMVIEWTGSDTVDRHLADF